MNTVNLDNFNETCEGYIIRALREADLNKEEVRKVLNGLRWAFDEMTMEDAGKEEEKYRQGKIKFKE